VPPFVYGTSTSWVPLQRCGLAFRFVPLLVAGSLRVTEGSSLVRTQRPPTGLRRCCQRLPFAGRFLPGARRASPVPAQPFPTCCRHYPAGSDRGISQTFRGRCCLRQDLRGSASRFSPHEACSTFDSYGPQGRSPDQARVCQEAPPPPFGCEASPRLHGFGFCHVGTFTHSAPGSSEILASASRLIELPIATDGRPGVAEPQSAAEPLGSLPNCSTCAGFAGSAT
jgi:hypothetical protein